MRKKNTPDPCPNCKSRAVQTALGEKLVTDPKVAKHTFVFCLECQYFTANKDRKKAVTAWNEDKLREETPAKLE